MGEEIPRKGCAVPQCHKMWDHSRVAVSLAITDPHSDRWEEPKEPRRGWQGKRGRLCRCPARTQQGSTHRIFPFSSRSHSPYEPTWPRSKQTSVAINRGRGQRDPRLSPGRMFTLGTGMR